jgi:uncharacterized protein DUF5677
MDDSKGSDQISKELKECINTLKQCLDEHIGVCSKLTGYLINHPSCVDLRKEQTIVEDSVIYTLLGLMQGLGASSHTIVRLSDDIGLHSRDCYSISRSIVESAINCCYVIAEGEIAAKKLIEHANEKSNEDLNRKSKIGKSEINLYAVDKNGNRLINDDDENNSNYIKSWTKLSVDKRIEIVGDKLSKNILESLHWARFMVYRHSSEILHGTLFGSLYFSGLTSPNKTNSIEEYINNIGQHHMMILLCVNFSIRSVIQSFDKQYGFEFIKNASDVIFKKINDIQLLKSN